MNNTLRYIIIGAALWLVIAYLSKSDEPKQDSGSTGSSSGTANELANPEGQSGMSRRPETTDQVYKSQVVR